MQRALMTWSLLLGLLAAPGIGQQGPKVYVAGFTTRDFQKNALTVKFTHDFEQALGQSGCYTVLESEKIERLLTELDREKAIADITQLSDSALANLKTEQADMAVFGEVFDDVESGQINITVTFQKFDRTKVLIKSILLSRGKANDAESRLSAMDELASELCRRTATVRRVTAHDFIFELEECRKQERDVTCELLVTNNGEDRDLYVRNYHKYGGKTDERTRMYDDFSSETLTSRIVLAGRNADRDGVESTLIAGRPAKLELSFEGVSSKMTTVTNLVIEGWESEHEVQFTVEFRNIPLKQ